MYFRPSLVIQSKGHTFFFRKIQSSQVNRGGDLPEAGWEALLQVLLCKSEVGWREGVTKIVVLITDAAPHVAGNGLMAGIWKPFSDIADRCSLRTESSTSWVSGSEGNNVKVFPSLDHDFPSLSDVDYQLEQDETTLIIGASSNALPLYEKMVTEQALYRAVAKNIGSDGRAESFFKQLLR